MSNEQTAHLLPDEREMRTYQSAEYLRPAVAELLRRLADARRELADCQAAYRDERHELRGR